jgi:hypothetical protein
MGGKRSRAGEYIYFCFASVIFLEVRERKIRRGHVLSQDPIGR